MKGITLLFPLLFMVTILAEDNFHLVSDANNQFALDFYKTYAKKEGNILYSPLSMHTVLSMIYQGAARETKDAFEKTLHVADRNLLADSYNKLLSHYNNVKDVQVALANRLYLQKECKLKEEAKTVLTEKYESGLEDIDFNQQEEAAKIINNFVANRTENKITELFTPDDFESGTNLVLLNTLYFSGQWDIPFFEEEYTYEAPFYMTSTSRIVLAKMMSTQDVYKANKDNILGASILELPFSNQRFSMVVLLPHSVDSITEVEDKLNYEELKRAINEMEPRYLELHFPKFRIEHQIDLKDPLTEMGLGVIFDKDKCNLSDLFENPGIYVNKAYQKVVIDVNESGCEAAAATGFATVDRMSAVSWRFNHPFLFVIIEKLSTDFNILFAGRVMNPTVV